MQTYQQIETKVLLDLDLVDEDFIGGGLNSEVMGYCNEAIHVAESVILSLCEDYFLNTVSIPIIVGTSDYDFPTDIYSDKLRYLVYSNGTLIYKIKRMRWSTAMEEIAYINAYPGQFQFYRHMIINDATTGRKIRLYPPAQETSSTYVTAWYIREARKVSALSDAVDIPEFHAFIEKYMKWQCLFKEGHPNTDMMKAAMEQEKQLMVNTLTNREPDNDDTIEQDMSFYTEHI